MQLSHAHRFPRPPVKKNSTRAAKPSREITKLNLHVEQRNVADDDDQSFQLGSEERCRAQRSGAAGQRDGFSGRLQTQHGSGSGRLYGGHKPPGLNYITGNIVASSKENNGPYQLHKSELRGVCVCVQVVNSPLSGSPITAYCLESDLCLSLRFAVQG